MDLKQILNFTLIKTDTVTISVYHLVVIFLIIVITRLVLWGIHRLFRREEHRRISDMGKIHAIFQLVKYVLWVVAIVLSLDTIGVKITLLLAGSAALLVGLGLGVQQIFKDIVSGVILLFEGTIKLGDIVELDSFIGQVKEIGIRTSKMETRDNIVVIIPNSRFIENNVINWSHIEKRTRFNVSVGVAYGSDVQLVKDILLSCADVQKDIERTPPPFVRFDDFGNSSLNFSLYFWTSRAFWVENIKSDLRFEIDARFRTNGVIIPFPQRDIHIIENNRNNKTED